MPNCCFHFSLNVPIHRVGHVTQMFKLKMKLITVLFVVVRLVISIDQTSNKYIGKCYFANVTDEEAEFTLDGERVTFECVSDTQDQIDDYFNIKSSNIECISDFAEKSVSKTRIVQINFTNCSMSTMRNYIFENFKNLNILDASSLGLRILQNEVFNVDLYLTKLNVSHNDITEVSSNLFVNAKKLLEVDISFNKITQIDPQAFAGNLPIQSLNLSHNNITHLHRELFDNLSRLQNLTISHNNIEHLGGQTFNNLTNLEFLDLSHNPIYELDKHLFTSCSKLKRLYLSHMELQLIEPKTFSHQEQLEILELSNNNLKVLDIRAFDGGIFLPKFDSLKYLSIARNKLHEFNGFSSERFPFVQIIGMDQNEFDCCELEKLLRIIDRKQLELPFDENTFHPKLLDARGQMCSFGEDFIYDGNEKSSQFNWTEVLLIMCMLLLAVIIGMVIMIIRQKKTYREPQTIEIQCERRENETKNRYENVNVYDVPKY